MTAAIYARKRARRALIFIAAMVVSEPVNLSRATQHRRSLNCDSRLSGQCLG